MQGSPFIPGAVAPGWGHLYGDFGGQIQQALSQFDDIQEFRKAVTAGYGTDVAALTGGAALRLQSLEATLLAAVQQDTDCRLFNKLEKSDAGATVDEYTVKERIGGFPGASFNSESGDIQEDQGEYERRVIQMKYLMTMRQVTMVQRSQKTLVDTMADQNMDATLQLMSSAEWAMFYGDSSCSSVEYDGVLKQLLTLAAISGNSDFVLDLRGKSITPAATEFIESAQFINGYGNFGKLTDYFCSNAIQADLDQKLDPAFRVNISAEGPQSIRIGAPVIGIRTSWGNIAANPDIFIQEGGMPFVARGAAFASNVTAAGVTAPGGVAVSVATNAASQFATAQGGLYYYAIEAGNKAGRSTIIKSTQQTINAGESAQIDITETPGGNETYYVIYRGRRNGTNADNDFREMIRVPKAGTGTTTFVDNNQWIPGTSIIALLTMAPGRKAVTFRRLLPLTRFPLFPTTKAVYPWAVLMFGALRLGKIRQHRVIINALPSSAAWQPF